MPENFAEIRLKYVHGLEAEFAKIDDRYQAIAAERAALADEINRVLGHFPDGYQDRSRLARPSNATASSSPGSGQRQDPDRPAKILAMVAKYPEGTTTVAIAKAIHVSNATAAKTVNKLKDDGQIHFVGDGPARKIYSGPAT